MSIFVKSATSQDISSIAMPFVQDFYSKLASGQANGKLMISTWHCDRENQCLLFQPDEETAAKLDVRKVSVSRYEPRREPARSCFNIEICTKNNLQDLLELNVFYKDMLPEERIQFERLFDLMFTLAAKSETVEAKFSRIFSSFK
ncbi:MAG: hypothetical protein NTX25_03400 [Proteobacteria bacterium]|nr:hypothetical protein [Pseudomonadota bacterium]